MKLLKISFLLAILLAGVAAASSISTLVGTGKPGFDDLTLNNPYGLVIGPDGALYFCDIDNHVVRRLDLKTRKLTVVAGSGQQGNSGDGGPATQAALGQPYEVRFDKAGDMYFADMPNNVVRKVDHKTGIISTPVGKDAGLKQPHSIAFDTDGSLLICDIGNHRVQRLDTKTGAVTTLLGTGEKAPTPEGAPVQGTPFYGPRAIAVQPDGTLYLVLREGNAVYKIDRKANKVTLVAGTGKKGLTGDGGPATQATLNGPKGISMLGNKMYLADTENHAIRVVDLKTGVITTVAGTGERGDGPDGDPRGCKMSRPHGVFAAKDGTVYIADSESHRIRVLR